MNFYIQYAYIPLCDDAKKIKKNKHRYTYIKSLKSNSTSVILLLTYGK